MPINSFSRPRIDNTRKSSAGSKEQIYATNVDFALIIVTLKDPTFSSIVLDKYLILCTQGNVEPVIVINKIDIERNTPEIFKYYQHTMGIQVLLTSVSTYEGLENLKQKVSKHRVVLLGKSGVGKSSIINALNPEVAIKVGEVSKGYGEGKHTTTETREYCLQDGTTLIDTPGLRNINLRNYEPSEICKLYPDFVGVGSCKYSDCLHVSEDGCCIKDALSAKLIPEERFNNYLKIIGKN